MCQFVDDLASVFPLALLQSCMVDSWDVWDDFEPLLLRPFAYHPVWIGYDPAKGTQNGDSAGCVVIAPPVVPGGKFRILERHQWRGMDFRARASAIEEITRRYNVTYIGIDSTGVGDGVYKTVKQFFPAAREFVYNPTVKMPRCLKPTTSSAGAVWSLTRGCWISRSPLCPFAVQPPPAATGQPTKQPAQRKPATRI